MIISTQIDIPESLYVQLVQHLEQTADKDFNQVATIAIAQYLAKVEANSYESQS